MSWTPSASARRASSGAFRVWSSQPSRIFSVTGTLTALTTERIKACAWSRLRINAEPESLPVTSLAGQPMLMSMTCRAFGFGDACAFRHPLLFPAGELDDERGQFATFGPAQHVSARSDEFFARYHLGNDEARTKPVRQPAKWQVAHAGHWCQHNRRRPVNDTFQHPGPMHPKPCLLFKQNKQLPRLWAD